MPYEKEKARSSAGELLVYDVRSISGPEIHRDGTGFRFGSAMSAASLAPALRFDESAL
jgi:hypothetical protein